MSNRTWHVELTDAPARNIEAATFEWNELVYIFDDGCRVVAAFPYGRVTSVTEIVASDDKSDGVEETPPMGPSACRLANDIRGRSFTESEAITLIAEIQRGTNFSHTFLPDLT